MASGAAPTLVRLERVGKVFPNGPAIEDLSLSVGEGEVVSLVGPSGCGKSTTLRLIAGLDAPDTGAIVWSGGAAPAMGFVFQDPTLMPWATVEANVALPLRLRGRDRAAMQGEVRSALAALGLADAGGLYPRELSGGMRMRASIARALIERPRLLLMDEPFAALDEMTRFRLNDDLLRLRRDTGATILFVTHSIYEAAYLSDRIVVMSPRPGRAVAEIAVDAPPDREGYRHAPAFMEMCRAVSAALRTAGAEAAA